MLPGGVAEVTVELAAELVLVLDGAVLAPTVEEPTVPFTEFSEASLGITRPSSWKA